MIDERTADISHESGGRLRILNAALPLFVQHGYKAVSMQQIADASRIHKATLYHHYRDKEALFMAVVQVELERIRAEMVEAIEQGTTAAERLVGVAWKYFQRSHADFGRLMSDVHEHLSQEHRNALLRVQAFPWEQMEDIFRQATRDGELPDVDSVLASSMFTGLIWGQIWVRKMERVTDPMTEQLARNLVEILLAGLRAAPAAATSGTAGLVEPAVAGGVAE